VSAATDGSGDVWAADLWGNRIERWRRTATGFAYASTIGAVLPPPTDTAIFHEPRGMAFTPGGDLWVADTVHHGFAKFNDDGDLLGVCGQRAAEGSRLGQFNWPRGLAVDPATGNLWVADTKQHQLQVLSPSCTGIGLVRNKPAAADAASFNWPYDIAIRDTDRFAFVVDTQNHRIKAYDVANAAFPDNRGPAPVGVFGSRGTAAANFRWPSGVAVGPDGHVYVADRGNNRIQELSFAAATGFRFVRSWNANGTLDAPEGVAVDSFGRVVVADSNDDQLVVMSPDRSVESTVGGLHHPAAVEVAPDGRVLVSDTYADVVRAYRLGAPEPPDTTAPTGTITTPTTGQRFPVGPVTYTGTATDNRAVGAVSVAVRRIDTATWLRPDGSYGAFAWLPASLAQPGAASSAWSFSHSLPAAGSYTMTLRVVDAAGNQSPTPRPQVRFSARAGLVDALMGAITSSAARTSRASGARN
jgi:DNA-binding beta-propeller fold protein YncE